MDRPRCGPLAAWATSWLAGGGPADDVIEAVTGSDAAHVIVGIESDPVPLSEILIRWRRGGGPVRLVLPAPGDLRGVPGPQPFRAAATDAGEAVFGAGIGLVPSITDFAPSSAPTSVTWAAHAVTPAPPDHLDVADTQYELTTAIRQCADELTAADVSGSRDDVLAALSGARRAGEQVNLPPGFPARAVALVAQAERMQAILDLALVDPVGGAVDQRGISARAAGLRPLELAVRRARLAGYNALAR
ncbi:MAG TPA: hypothetical protein VGN35_04560 [Jatrophihabitantaceae bacterium]|nr:hypothetical protein [Jatrophihabitantaceae bacterium]